MHADPRAESSVEGAWEVFQGGEPPPAGSVRELVQSSWQRCAESAVDPELRRSTAALSEQDLYLLRERRRDLVEASAPVLAEAGGHLADSGSLLVLSDRAGTILGVEGDRSALDLGETIRLMPGADWSEARCGTNAIGTALRIGSPLQIHSTEHYCSGIKRWTCSAAVVRHPRDGTPFAAVDVSGLARTFHRQSLGLVVASARAIEERLALRELAGRVRLLEQAMVHWSAAAGEAQVLFDRHGALVKASAGAQAAIDAAGAGLDLATTRCLPEFAVRRHGRLRLPPWLRPEWLQPLVVGGECLGTLLVLPTVSPRARPGAGRTGSCRRPGVRRGARPCRRNGAGQRHRYGQRHHFRAGLCFGPRRRIRVPRRLTLPLRTRTRPPRQTVALRATKPDRSMAPMPGS